MPAQILNRFFEMFKNIIDRKVTNAIAKVHLIEITIKRASSVIDEIGCSFKTVTSIGKIQLKQVYYATFLVMNYFVSPDKPINVVTVSHMFLESLNFFLNWL